MWVRNLPWNKPIPDDLWKIWNEFYTQLHNLNSLKIPRNVIPMTFKVIELHCFVDASKNAYATCIYVRSFNFISNIYQSHLLCSKSKVSPIKPTTTIPRLELWAALLGAQLSNQVNTIISNSIHTIYWSDSQIVLTWLRLEPAKLQQYVANRVSKIQQLSNIQNWNYVPSQHNPADLQKGGVCLIFYYA